MQPPPGQLREVWTPGTVVGQAYRLEVLLGSGGFGSVFRGTHLPSGTAVAIKILSPEAMSQKDSLARFAREAKLAMSLRHPSTVRVLDSGDAGDGTPFIAFEFLHGESLEARLARGALPGEEAVRVALELLGSLSEAHRLSIVHRDVKPANVYLCASPPGLVKLLDFGVAKLATAAADGQGLTAEGLMVGTPAYMAPEQISGQPVGPATDLFALALVLSEMITKEQVYQGAPLAVCLDKLRGNAPPWNRLLIPPRLLAILERAGAIDPAHRFGSAEEMQRALAEYLATAYATPSSASPAKHSGSWGTLVMDLPQPPATRPEASAPLAAAATKPSSAPPAAPASWSESARAAQASPLASTNLPAQASQRFSAVDPMAITRPPQKNPSLAATAPEKPDAALAATFPIATPRRGVPALAATLDANAASGMKLTLPMRDLGPPPLAQPTKKASRGWVVLVAILVVLVAAGLALARLRFHLI